MRTCIILLSCEFEYSIAYGCHRCYEVGDSHWTNFPTAFLSSTNNGTAYSIAHSGELKQDGSRQHSQKCMKAVPPCLEALFLLR